MASAFGHAALAWTGSTFLKSDKVKSKLTFIGIISSILPDADVLAFKFGIPYEHPLGHRGFTHSLFFALFWSILMWWGFLKKDERKLGPWLYLFFCTVSHGIVDAMTTGGRGIGFFIPLDNERYFFPLRFIKVSPIRVSQFFSDWGLQVILSEALFIGVPCLFVIMLAKWSKRFIS